MLLLILLASCLASCSAQSSIGIPAAVAVNAVATNATEPAPTAATTTITTPSAPPGNTVAYIVAAVQSDLELNEGIVVAALGKVKLLIQQISPRSDFSLTLKSITLQKTRTV